MNVSLHDRLNIALAAVVRSGTSRPEGWLVDQILAPPKAVEAANASSKAPRPKRMTREAAEKTARDLAGYDGRIAGGRLT